MAVGKPIRRTVVVGTTDQYQTSVTPVDYRMLNEAASVAKSSSLRCCLKRFRVRLDSNNRQAEARYNQDLCKHRPNEKVCVHIHRKR